MTNPYDPLQPLDSYFDVNVFCGAYPFRSLPAENPEQLRALLKQARMEGAIVTPFPALFHSQGWTETLHWMGAFAEDPHMAFWAVINPAFPGWQEDLLEAARSPKVAGIRLFPRYHGYNLFAPQLAQLLELAKAHKLPVHLSARLLDDRLRPRLLHVDPPLDLEEVAGLLKLHPTLTWVLGGFYMGELKALASTLRALPQGYADIGCAKPTEFWWEGLEETFPAERLLLGTGAPLYYHGGSRLSVHRAQLDPDTREALLRTNAHALLAQRQISPLAPLDAAQAQELIEVLPEIDEQAARAPASLGLRIIDAHLHQWSIFSNFSNIGKFLDQNPEVHWLVLASDLRGGYYPSEQEIYDSNQSTLRAMDMFSDRIQGWCYVNPRWNSARKELWRGLDAGLLGLKLWVATRCSDPLTFPVVETAIEAGVPILVHTWKKATGNLAHESLPVDMAVLARRYPEGRFLMAHMGGEYENGIRAISDCPNVWVDFAGTISEYGAYEMAVRELGEERVVFGTDLPADFHTNLGRVLQGNWPTETLEKILATNFETLLGRQLPH